MKGRLNRKSQKTLIFKQRFEEVEKPERLEVGGKSGGVIETQKEDSFKNEVVTKSVKKGLREKKVEGKRQGSWKKSVGKEGTWPGKHP